MFKKILGCFIISGICFAASFFIANTPIVFRVAEAGEFTVSNLTVVVDDSSVYYVGDNHVRVAFKIITNSQTGAYTSDIADVRWGKGYKVITNKFYERDIANELQLKLANYCSENY